MFDAAAAIRILFQSMNSPSQLGWQASGDDPRGQYWKGITCSNNRVTEMYKLSNLKLTGTLPYGLQPLTSLTNPDLSSNNLGGGIPYQLPPNMQCLNLAYNNFTGAIPYSISDMTSLTDLCVIIFLSIYHNNTLSTSSMSYWSNFFYCF
ncbi:hypothetical protein Ahy_B04g071257 isoform F [Arachis hypogaea]|uniref:Leucine-rich repeat-containing N-terminal plant-type domain-containing protein n=1 Tax=Arachis hypogaea TaxID=3818 RepID=A0A444ZKC6_ARAHY|nr:hypothetical protein Ahy_B04g071257 isoform F [Arachis hypogaea]